VIADPDRMKIGQKAPKDKQEQRQRYCTNPIKDTLADWKPMKGTPHEFTNVAELGDTTDQSSSGSEYTIQRSQANIMSEQITTKTK